MKIYFMRASCSLPRMWVTVLTSAVITACHLRQETRNSLFYSFVAAGCRQFSGKYGTFFVKWDTISRNFIGKNI